MSSIAKGSFAVDVKPLPEPDVADGVTLGRMSLDKRFEGDLVATGRGQMLTAMTPVQGSAGYVAIERALSGKALARLNEGKIKGRSFRVRKI